MLEDLQIRNMSRSAKGTVEEPGKNVAPKAGLNKAILDQGWGMFRHMLEYKQHWRGGEVICSQPTLHLADLSRVRACRKENRVQQALFSCVVCDYTYHADVVAAKNILALGHRERFGACSPR